MGFFFLFFVFVVVVVVFTSSAEAQANAKASLERFLKRAMTAEVCEMVNDPCLHLELHHR